MPITEQADIPASLDLELHWEGGEDDTVLLPTSISTSTEGRSREKGKSFPYLLIHMGLETPRLSFMAVKGPTGEGKNAASVAPQPE